MLRVEKRTVGGAAKIQGTRTLSIPFEIRQKSRFRAALEDGTELAVFLPRGSSLADGDLLEADDGTLIRIAAAPERLLYVTATSPEILCRAAYHLGNRHTLVEIGNGFLKLENDPVLKEMLRGLGLNLRETDLPFHPEAGAYHGGHRHNHDPSEHEHIEEQSGDRHSFSSGESAQKEAE